MYLESDKKYIRCTLNIWELRGNPDKDVFILYTGNEKEIGAMLCDITKKRGSMRNFASDFQFHMNERYLLDEISKLSEDKDKDYMKQRVFSRKLMYTQIVEHYMKENRDDYIWNILTWESLDRFMDPIEGPSGNTFHKKIFV